MMVRLSSFCLLLFAFLLSSCSTNSSAPTEVESASNVTPSSSFQAKGFKIERVKIDVLSSLEKRSRNANVDPMISFNQRRRLHGAVSNEERAQRYGQYFTVDWESLPKTAGTATLEFSYRQQNTAAELHQKQRIVQIKGGEQFTEFAVVGEEFKENGLVTSWQLRIFVEDELVASQSSFLWD